MTCNICHSALASSEEGRTNHYKKFHNVIVKRQYVKMDVDTKRRIVRKFEEKHPHSFLGNVKEAEYVY